MSAGNILRLMIEVVMAANRKRAPIRHQHKLNIIFSVLLVFIFGVLSCVLKTIFSPPFFASLYHKSVNISTMPRQITQKASVCTKRNIIGRSPHHCEAHHYKIDPQSKYFRNRSISFCQRIDLSLGDDGRKKLSEVFRAFAPCAQTNLCKIKKYRVFLPWQTNC